MTGVYKHVFRLYPAHIRAIYGREMLASFEERQASVGGRVRMLQLLIGEICRMLPDIACERLAMFSSHASFRGPCFRNPGIVRPPNVGKKEWFYGDKR